MTCYFFNPAVRVAPIADSEGVLCTLPGARQQMSIRETTLTLLRLFDGTRTTAEVLEAYEARYGRPSWTLPELERFVSGSCLHAKLLLTNTPDGSTPLANAVTGGYLFVRKSVFPARVVQAAVRPLGWLFSPSMAMVVMTIVLLGHSAVYWLSGRHIFTVPRFYDGIEGLGLFAVSVILHEIGHASALIRFGCRDVDIGVGLYLHIPIVYTNASDAWRLSRRERVVIDLAGVYFQLIFATLLICLFLTKGAAGCGYAVALIDGSLLLSLNPFLRMDGYWLLSDVCRIRNLRKHSLAATRSFLGWSWWRSDQAAGELTKSQRTIVSIYAVASIVFSLYLLLVLLQYALDNSIPYWRMLSHVGVARGPALITLMQSTGKLGCLAVCGFFVIRNVWTRVKPK